MRESPLVKRIVQPVFVLAAAAITIAATLPQRDASPLASYAALSPAQLALALAPAYALVIAGAVSWFFRARGGSIAIAAGVAWLAPEIAASLTWPAETRTAALVAAALALPITAHALLRQSGSGHRLLIAVAYTITTGLAVAHAAVYDPFLDRYCWITCSHTTPILHQDAELARQLATSQTAASLVIGVSLAATATRGFVRDPRRPTITQVAVLAACLLVGLAAASSAALLLTDPAESPLKPLFVAAHDARAVAALVGAVAIGAVTAHAVRVRAAIAGLSSALDTIASSGSLESDLARATGDPSIRIAYPIVDDSRVADSAGVAIEPAPGQVATRLVRRGETVALVFHDPRAVSARELERNLGQTACLALGIERYRAELQIGLSEARRGRIAVVVAGDAVRRRLERDLHDGAQQRILFVLFRLGRARATMPERLVPQIDEATEQVREALEQLREIAHGIYPATLGDIGLLRALTNLAERAPLVVMLTGALEREPPLLVSRTAYAIVSSSIDGARFAGAERLSVHATTYGEELRVAVGPRQSLRPEIVDRINALGGMITESGSGTMVTLPCGSLLPKT